MHSSPVILPVLLLFSLTVWTRVIVKNSFELQTPKKLPWQSRPPMNKEYSDTIKRASTSILQSPNVNTQPNGWNSYYTPILPFDVTDKSAADLSRFYELLQSEIRAAIAENYPQGEELLFEDNQIRLDIRSFDHNNLNPTPIPDYHIVLDFLAYIIAKTKRGYTGKYRVSWVKANVTITFTLLLGALAVGGAK